MSKRERSNDDNVNVRRAVARNPNTPWEALSRLANDSDAGVREAVAENPSAPPNALALLASDGLE